MISGVEGSWARRSWGGLPGLRMESYLVDDFVTIGLMRERFQEIGTNRSNTYSTCIIRSSELIRGMEDEGEGSPTYLDFYQGSEAGPRYLER
jgi:hypothetical protein